jgi:hypothetical protein
VAVFGGFIGKYNMSKFLKLCEKVQKTLNEENGLPPSDPNPQVAPGQPVEQDLSKMVDPKDSKTQEVSNTTLEQMIQTIVTFYQSGQTLSADAVSEISKLPKAITKENSEDTVKKLMEIFNSADLPQSTGTTS